MITTGPSMWAEPIDAVVTWVDGADPRHAAKRAKALSHEKFDPIESIPAGRSETRFCDNGELMYCLRGLRKFAPWIRTIHLVTDAQRPVFLTDDICEEWRVNIVDHREIFSGYEHVLPTFNSITIETALHRVPGLASHYLYLNDDFILVGATRPEDFFVDGKVVLRGEWRPLADFSRGRLALSALANFVFKTIFGIDRSLSLLQQMRAARLAGMRKEYYRSPHVPHPIRKDVLGQFFEDRPDVFEENVRHRFRHADQFVATFLANHLEIAREGALCVTCPDHVMICFNRDSARTVNEKINMLRSSSSRFFCLQSFEQANPNQRSEVIAFLESRLSPDSKSGTS